MLQEHKNWAFFMPGMNEHLHVHVFVCEEGGKPTTTTFCRTGFLVRAQPQSIHEGVKQETFTGGLSQTYDSGVLWTPLLTSSIQQSPFSHSSSCQLVTISAPSTTTGRAESACEEPGPKSFPSSPQTASSSFLPSRRLLYHISLAQAHHACIISRLHPGHEQRAPRLQIPQLSASKSDRTSCP